MIKIATPADFDKVKELSTNFFYASPYKDMPLEEDKQTELIEDLMEKYPYHGMIACMHVDNEVQGIIAGCTSEILFSRSKIATELVWWVEPDYRKTKGSLLLLDCFEYWAEKVAGADIVQMVALEDDSIGTISRFYTRRGYTPVERGFIKHFGRN